VTPSSAKLVPTSFSVGVPVTKASSSTARSTKYVGAGATTATITLSSVNGASPPSGLTTSVSTTLSGSPPYTVNGPLVPPGTDVFTITTSDGATPPALLATATTTVVVAAGTSASGGTITLAGIPASVQIGALPSAVADTASTTPLSFTVLDADGNTITGAYANPITVSLGTLTLPMLTYVSGSLGASLVYTPSGGAAAAPASGATLVNSGDTVQLVYSGRAISPARIAAIATGISQAAMVSFAPSFNPITIGGTTAVDGSGNPEIDLYAPSGTGSSATFTAAELGFTDSPFSQSLTATPYTACNQFGTISSPSANSFTFTAKASPTAGTCTIQIGDGLGNSKLVTATYTAFGGFGVN
jgi:hypothetical protein